MPRHVRVRTAALVGIAVCLFSSALGIAARAAESDTCGAVTRDLRGQIEVIKRLKVQSGDSLTTSRKHPAEPPQQIAARDREQAEVLNQMLPAMGCASLDIEQELAKPADQALLPAAAPKKHKKHKH